MKHPIQKPIDVNGTWRFTENKIVSYLVDECSNLNEISAKFRNDHPEDYDQLMMLIGYSISGAPISQAVCNAADEIMKTGKSEYQVRAEIAEEQLKNLRNGLANELADLFEHDAGDLKGEG